jgi:hypothetical protein
MAVVLAAGERPVGKRHSTMSLVRAMSSRESGRRQCIDLANGQLCVQAVDAWLLARLSKRTIADELIIGR